MKEYYLNTNCPICNSQNLKPSLKVTDHSISQERFTISQCSECGFHLTNPRPKNEDLAKYYESDDYISHSETRKSLISKAYHFVQRINLNLKFKVVDKYVPRGTWVDYGAGAGAFAAYCKNHIHEIIGFEPNSIARKNAQQKGVELKSPLHFSEISDDSVDAITLWHVLEHIPELNEILALFKSKLKPGACLFIAVPNHNSYDANHYKSHWAAYDVPRHLWHFTQKDIENLAHKHGLDLRGVKPQYFDSFYVALLSASYKNSSKFSALLVGLISNLLALLNKYPYSSQIYILSKRA